MEERVARLAGRQRVWLRDAGWCCGCDKVECGILPGVGGVLQLRDGAMASRCALCATRIVGVESVWLLVLTGARMARDEVAVQQVKTAGLRTWTHTLQCYGITVHKHGHYQIALYCAIAGIVICRAQRG